ncbi:MAG: signal peptidase I [Clostridia bacterium]|jgi:signal peptidase I|nr:signal peptidase I [Clostridia bacterium]
MKRKMIIFSTLILIMFNISVFKIYWIPSDSMKDTIKKNDFIYVYQLPYILNYGDPQYDEIFVFRYPLDEKFDYVKRLIGKPNDIILIDNNKIFRNNEEVEETYLSTLVTMEDFGPIIVPEESYFFMGDNRNNSTDSREWGFVKYSQIKGKVIKVLWP